MIKFISVNSNNYAHYKALATRLIRNHKDGHITVKGFKQFSQITKDKISKKENTLILALYNNKVVGMLACGEKGHNFAITVVHKDYRGHGIAKGMLKKAIDECGSFYCEVASDNLPSLKTCFTCNMVATDAFIRKGKVIMKMNTLNNT